MAEDADDDIEEFGAEPPQGGLPGADGGSVSVLLGPDEAGGRLDKTLAARLPDLSRSRIQALIAEGALTRDGLFRVNYIGGRAPVGGAQT